VASLFSIGDLLRAQRHVAATEMSIQRTAQAGSASRPTSFSLSPCPAAWIWPGLIDGLEEIKKKLPGDGAVNVPSPGSTRTFSTPARGAHTPTCNTACGASPPAPCRHAGIPALPVAAYACQRAEVRSRWTEFVTEVSRAKISVGTVLGSTTLLGVQEWHCADRLRG